MDAQRIERCREANPFIDKFLNDLDLEEWGVNKNFELEEIINVRTKKVDKNLLKQKAYAQIYEWALARSISFVKFIVFYQNEGGKIKTFIPKPVVKYENPHTGDDFQDAETIGEQITANNITPLQIIKFIRENTDKDGSGKGFISRYVIAYKM